MKGLVILLVFLFLLGLATLYAIVRIYLQVWQDLQSRAFSDPTYKNLWLITIFVLPPVGGLIYYAIYVYVPPEHP